MILRPGDGDAWMNGRELDDYFPRPSTARWCSHRWVAGLEGQYDLRVRVHGGGSGQAGAVRHGIARALVEADPELRVPLKREGFLARDARGGAQEGRPPQGPQGAPVLEALG